MKIAVASQEDQVSEHFGRCRNLYIFETKSKEIVKSELINNPRGGCSCLPDILNELGVELVISGGMGEGAQNHFKEKGIQVITGASGNVDEVVKEYLNDNLQSTETICREHHHQGNCSC